MAEPDAVPVVSGRTNVPLRTLFVVFDLLGANSTEKFDNFPEHPQTSLLTDHLNSRRLHSHETLCAPRLMRLMQSPDAFNATNLHWALISCARADIPLMESLMRNRSNPFTHPPTLSLSLSSFIYLSLTPIFNAAYNRVV